MKSEQSTFYANRGVERNKTPLKNILYRIIIHQLKEGTAEGNFIQYKFKDLGYLVLEWKHEDKNDIWNFHGFVTPEGLKERLGEKQWSKFCQGKREFTIQRRINGKNIPKNN